MKSMVRALALTAVALGGGCASSRTETNTISGFRTSNQLFSADLDNVTARPVVNVSDNVPAGRDLTLIEASLNLYRQAASRAYQAEHRRLQLPVAASPSTNDRELFTQYRSAGWRSSRIICQYTLDLLGQSQSDYRFTHRTIDLVSGFIATVMGIAGADSRSLAYYAAGDALVDTWSQDFEEYAFIAANVSELERLIFQAQDEFAESRVTPPEDWASATSDIQTYNRVCLATGMRNLIRESVAGAEVRWDGQAVRVVGARTAFSAGDDLVLPELVRALENKRRLAALSQDAQRAVNSTAQAIAIANLEITAVQATLQGASGDRLTELNSRLSALQAQLQELDAERTRLANEATGATAALAEADRAVQAAMTNATRQP